MHKKIGSQDKVFALLSALAAIGAPITARELAELTGLPLSSTYRYLSILTRWALVQEREVGKYAPGPMAVQLAVGFEQRNSLLTWARPLLEQLAERSGESAALMMATGDRVLCVEMIDSSQPLRCCYQKGQSQPLLQGASAKVLLAFMTDEERDHALANLAQAEREALFRILATIREQGYAVSEGEIDPGVWGVSAPVFGSRDNLLGAISLMAPGERAGSGAAQWLRWTCETATRLGSMLH